jgi:hypothetical protein
MEEKIVPTGGPMFSQTRETIERNGGSVGPTEVVLRNIQEERPYLNTSTKKVIFKSREYVYYNENGIWTDSLWPPT